MLVNLTSSATLADMESPEGRAQFAAFLESAYGRLVRDFKALHVLKVSESEYLSLDTRLRAPDLRLLTDAVSDAVLAMSPDAVLPLQSVDDWWKFWCSPFVTAMVGYRCPLYKHSRVALIVRGGEWPR